MVMRNFRDKLKRFFWFSPAEVKVFILVVIALGFIASWDEWGAVKFDAAVGLKNLIISVIAMLSIVFVHHAAQRIAGLKAGFRVEHKLWWYGLLAGLILVAVSNGKLQFLAGTITVAHFLPIHRLGKHRPGPNVSTLSSIMLAGPLANVLFAAIIHVLTSAGVLGVLGVKLMTLSLWFALCNLLPLPSLDGAYVLYHSRALYVFVFATVAAYSFLAIGYDLWSFGAALLLGFLISLVLYWLLGSDEK